MQCLPVHLRLAASRVAAQVSRSLPTPHGRGRMPLVDEAEAARRLEQLTGWELADKSIRKSYRFRDFAGALEFVNCVGDLAERANHHPDIDIRYNRVTLVLSTHSAGGLTEKDFDLARGIDETTPAN